MNLEKIYFSFRVTIKDWLQCSCQMVCIFFISSVPSFSRRNLFILNKSLISGKILIPCRELYFEVVGHVYLIRMGYVPENEIFTVKDQVQNDTYS